MTRAEIKVAFIKKYSVTKNKRKQFSKPGMNTQDIMAMMNEMTDEQILEDINEGKESQLFRSIVPINIKKDNDKTTTQIFEDIYRHSEDKVDINRNMLATIFARNPKKFEEKDEEVQKLL